ncbi:MAG: Mo-co oxidoreductase dimerization domain protein [Verrucomicrobiales bacterium]|nr:Mo-co oxidoreductase dimerization domain protein [Verrucomicrobiales bacterium]
MTVNKWTLGLTAVTWLSLPLAVRGDEKGSPTTVSSTVLSGYVDMLLHSTPGYAAAAPLTNSAGLVLYYSFDSLTGSTVTDLSGNGNHGLIYGAQHVADGKTFGALNFASTATDAAFVLAPNSASLVSMQGTHELTFAAWIQPRTLPYEFPVVLSKGGNAFPGGYEFALNANGDNDLIFTSGGCDVYSVGANGQWINQHLNQWIHLAFTVQSTGAAQFFINGQPTGDATPIGVCNNGFNFAVNNDLYIGAPDPASHPNRSIFNGLMDELALFNRALSPSEIQALYESGVNGEALLGARSLLENVLTELLTLQRNLDERHARKLNQAIEDLSRALRPGLWLGQNHLAGKTGEKVFEQTASAIRKLCHWGTSLEAGSVDPGFVDRILSANRTLALVAIQDAAAAGTSGKKLRKAGNELLKLFSGGSGRKLRSQSLPVPSTMAPERR